ncbi:GNAT family N-acetyltransferase, partial [Calothrix sp. HK-06]
MIQEWQRGEYIISTDVSRLDLSVIHLFLANSYWAEELPLEILQRSIQNSLVFGLYKGKEQIGFARIITDYSTFAYISDVFVLELGCGTGKNTEWLSERTERHLAVDLSEGML